METLVNQGLYELLVKLIEVRRRKKELETQETEIKDDIQIQVDFLPEDWEFPCAVKSTEEDESLPVYKFPLRMGSQSTVSAEALKLLGVDPEIIRKATKTTNFPVIGTIEKL